MCEALIVSTRTLFCVSAPNSVACTTSTYSPTTCGQVATFDNFQPNLAAEQKKITNDIAPFRVYPIMNVGVTYRF